MNHEEYLELRFTDELKGLEREERDFLDKILTYVRKADTAFVYREYKRDENQNSTVLWVKEKADTVYDVIDIDYEIYGNRETVIAENNEKIYYIL